MNVLSSVVGLLLKINLLVLLTNHNTEKINSKHKRNCCTQPASVYRTDTVRKMPTELFTINLGIFLNARRRASS